MRFLNNNKFSIAGGVLSLIPFLFLANYIHLSVDDFCRYDSKWSNYSSNISEWLTFHNGRYTNAALSLIPAYDLQTYRLISLISIITFFSVTLLFFYQIYRFSQDSNTKLSLSIISLVFLTNQLPATGEFFFWYAGITTYLFSFLFIISLILSLIYYNYPLSKFFLIPVLLIIIIGNNELALVVSFFLTLGFGIFYSLKSKRIQTNFVFYFLIFFICFFLVLNSQANHLRISSYSENQDVFQSLVRSGYSTVIFFIRKIFNLSFLILSMLVIFFSDNNFKSKEKLFLPLLSLGLIGSIFTLFFVSYFSLGSFNAYNGRIGNFFSLVFYTSAIICINEIVCLFKVRKISFPFKLYNLNFFGFLILFGIFNFSEFPSYHAWKDLFLDKAEKYDQQVNVQYDNLNNSNFDIIDIRNIEQPTSLKTPDVLQYPTLERSCFENMLREKYEVKFQKAIYHQ